MLISCSNRELFFEPRRLQFFYSYSSSSSDNKERMGKGSWYSANITCDPDINLVHHGNMYMLLKENASWEIPLFPNCSKVFISCINTILMIGSLKD